MRTIVESELVPLAIIENQESQEKRKTCIIATVEKQNQKSSMEHLSVSDYSLLFNFVKNVNNSYNEYMISNAFW